MPLLQRRELLQRQRVDPAEQGQRPLGAAQPLLLLGADVRRRVRLDLAAPRPAPAATAGTSWCGPYSATRASGSTPRSSSAFSCSASIRSRCSARATSSRCTQSVSRSSSAAELAQPAADGAQLGVPLGPGRLGALAGLGRAGQRVLQVGERGLRGQRDLAAPPRPRGPGALRRACGPGPVRRAPGRRPGPAGRPGRPAPGPAPRRCAPRAGPRPRPAGRPGRPPRARRAARCRARASSSAVADCCRGGVPLLELGQRRPVGRRAASTAGRDRALQPLGLAAGGAGLGAELAELLGHGRHPGVGLVQPVQGGLHVPGRDGLLVHAPPAARTAARSSRCAGLAEPGGRPRRPRPAPRAGSARWPTRRRRCSPAEQVALAGDRDQRRAAASTTRRAVGEVVDDRRRRRAGGSPRGAARRAP